jgi:alanine-synthesizing transaminase
LQERIAANLAFLDATFADCDAATRLEREGGWYAVLRVPRATPSAPAASDESLTVSLLELASVLVHPGAFYNFASEGFLVLSLIAPPAAFEQGVRLLKNFLINF